ncbi:sensor histidine kinase [Pontivivens ytuae]|uniref:C4-dicarboxylate transport sensor protein DctB n=1 Tax=Pontivivens ytuae TaxID=2789856 RepID=A0A7S9QC97_9RHOB|nr:ATP-binding protein [Pontivivens ytuae]QPH53600.1 sensor histidine kinase [Pontivivens ytuae]
MSTIAAPTQSALSRVRARLRSLRRAQVILIALCSALVVITLWASAMVVSNRFMDTLGTRAAVRSTLYTNSIESVLSTYTVASSLLAQDRLLVGALSGAAEDQIRLILGNVQSTTGALSISLYTAAGGLVADTQPEGAAINHALAPYFQLALEQDISIFATVAISEVEQRFFFARRILQSGTILGVVIIEVDLASVQDEWVATPDQVFVTNSEDLILLSSRPEWRYRSLSPFLDPLSAQGAGRFALLPMLNLEPAQAGQRVAIDGEVYLRVDRPVEFRGWTVTYLAPVAEVRERVRGVLAIEVMAIAILASLAFFQISRRAARQSLRLKRESEELRALNARLSSEIEERLKVEQSLQAAEESLEQSSKLAALGQMSAAISHELNQPLAAMKTYLAGAQLLIQRNRPGEALTSFQRIDDLITRMGAITRQLKTFARKGGTDLLDVDLRASLSSALAIMSPQIGQSNIAIVRREPEHPVMVNVDTVRLEQVLINLLRNAIDAMRGQSDPQVTVEIFAGPQMARIQVRDTGPGFEGPPSALFEPFYTTKAPGEGVGLGLAISAGIARDMGGSLTARNGRERGAVFELSLPRVTGRPERGSGDHE